MSNELEKRGKDQAVTAPGSKMAAALAKLHDEIDARDNAARASAPGVRAGEIFDQQCVCAEYDLRYIIRHVKQANGRWLVTESIRLDEGQSSGRGGGSAQAMALSVSEIDGPDLPCAWCGGKGLYHCDCGVVCGGRVRGNVFYCRASCGAHWITGRLAREIRGTASRQEPQQWKAPPRRVSSVAPAKPETANRLLLGPGEE